MMQPLQRPSGLRFLENLAYLVPGYHGYRQHESRRGEDSRLRALVCRRIQRLLADLDGLAARWSDCAPEDSADVLREGRRRLAGHEEAVRLAPGELGRFFESERVPEVTLERLLESDLLIFEDLEAAETHLEHGRALSTAPRAIRRFVRDLDQILGRLEEHLIRRERVMAGG